MHDAGFCPQSICQSQMMWAAILMALWDQAERRQSPKLTKYGKPHEDPYISLAMEEPYTLCKNKQETNPTWERDNKATSFTQSWVWLLNICNNNPALQPLAVRMQKDIIRHMSSHWILKTNFLSLYITRGQISPEQ